MCLMQLDKYEADRIVGVTMGIKVIVNNQFKVAYVNARSFEKAHGRYSVLDARKVCCL